MFYKLINLLVEIKLIVKRLKTRFQDNLYTIIIPHVTVKATKLILINNDNNNNKNKFRIL